MRKGLRVPAAVFGAVAASGLLAASAVRAARIDALSPTGVVTDAPFPGARADGAFERPEVPGERRLVLAEERNPFHPERRRGGAFSLGGEDEIRVPQPPPRAVASLSGTALVGGARDFILCQSEPDPWRIVRLGEPCGALVLVAVERGRATFRDPEGDDVVLEMPKVGSN
ncbi:MAG TPA: hypothetical protein VMM12_03480 [Longimicrobiales bacterium]|nr:hypothetical protein [Longimicrobiales bacterium]